uniref:PPM-type phosphatase domain-containing protein n=1 Tax=Heterorhabditis bacteriophora TaxID=37862 RepID=A0A1I7X3H6_HETBA
MTLENSNSKKKGICSSPNTARSRYGNNLRITVAANQGGRKYMEDRVQIETFRREDGSIRFTFLGVFDGHGGAEASEYVRMHLLNNIMSSDLFDSNDDDEFLEAIRLGFLMTHHMIWKVVPDWPPTASGYPSTAGTTVSVAFIKNGKLYTGHVGDSAIILGKRTCNYSVHNQLVPERLTVDHKPENEEEQTRIRLAGGSVSASRIRMV